MTVIQSGLISDDELLLTPVIWATWSLTSCSTEFGWHLHEAARHRRKKLRVDDLRSAIVMKVEYFIAQLTLAETFAVSRQTFISGKTHLPKIARKKCFFAFKTFFSVRFFQISFKRREEKKQFYNLGRYMCALAVWSEKVQRTISRLFEYEKNRIQIYVLQYFALLLRVRAERTAEILTNTDVAVRFFLCPSRVIPRMYLFLRAAEEKHFFESKQQLHLCSHRIEYRHGENEREWTQDSRSSKIIICITWRLCVPFDIQSTFAENFRNFNKHVWLAVEFPGWTRRNYRETSSSTPQQTFILSSITDSSGWRCRRNRF